MTATSAYEQVQNQVPSEVGSLEQYLPLVKRIAYHLKGRLPDSVFVDDLIQSGIVGLIEAMQKFNANQGASFETYAGIRIRGSMLDEIRKGDWTPRSVYRKSRAVSAAINEVESKKGREARDEEIAAEMELTLDEYHHILQDTNSVQLLSIDQPDHEALSEDRMIGNGLTPYGELVESGFQEALVNEIGSLPEREQLVMSLYYDEELNLKEIGEVLDVSESRVSQIHSQAVKRIRSRMSSWIK